MSTPALTLATSSETPAVQACWLQTPHPGLVCACSGTPSPPGTSEPSSTQDRGLRNISLPHFNKNWLAGVNRCPANAPSTHRALTWSHQTWDWHQTSPDLWNWPSLGKKNQLKPQDINVWEISLPELLHFLSSSTPSPKWSISQWKRKRRICKINLPPKISNDFSNNRAAPPPPLPHQSTSHKSSDIF